jgi:hypothetical protein
MSGGAAVPLDFFEILWAQFCSLRGRQNEQSGAGTVLRLARRELFPLCWPFLASCDSPAELSRIRPCNAKIYYLDIDGEL